MEEWLGKKKINLKAKEYDTGVRSETEHYEALSPSEK